MNLDTLKLELKSKTEAMQGLLAAGNDLSADDSKKLGELNAEVKDLRGKLAVASEASATIAELNKPAGTFTHFEEAGATKHGEVFVEKENGNIKAYDGAADKNFSDNAFKAASTTSYKDAWHRYLKGGLHSLGHTDMKILQEGVDNEGGFLVPEEIQRRLIEKRPAPTNMLNSVTRLKTSRDSLTIPRSIWTADDIYTNPIRYTQTGEIPFSSSQATYTDPNFGQARIDVYTQMLNGALSKDMIEDSMFDLQSWLGDKFAEARDLTYESFATNGTGANGPTGLLANPGGSIGDQPQPAVIAMGSPMGADGLIALAYSVPPQYDGNCRYMFNKQSAGKTIAQLKDANDRYLFSYGFTDYGIASARPKELLGYDYSYNQFMPNVGANAYPVAFGDFSGFYFVERIGLSVQVLDQIQALQNQVVLVARLRFGCQTVEDWKIKVGQVAA